MTIAEGSGVRLAYKFYAVGTMVAGTEAVSSSDPGASGGQILRYTQSSLNLKTTETKSAEILPSRQLRSSRRTSRHVEGSITGELSPGTYFDFMEATLRGTRANLGVAGSGATFVGHYGIDSLVVTDGGTGYAPGDVITVSSTGSGTVVVDTVDGSGVILTAHVGAPGSVTSLTSNPLGQASVSPSGGTGVSLTLKYKVVSVTSSGGSGYTVGDTLVFHGITADSLPTAHISVATTGAATTDVVDTAGHNITVAATSITANASTPGSSISVPSSGHVRRKVLVERNNTDLDLSRLYTEMRVTGFKISVPSQGISTIEVMFMGRNRATVSGASAPFFTDPAAATTTEVCDSLTGSLSIGGTQVGLVTAATINVVCNSEAPNVLGQQFAPDVLVGTLDCNGTFTFLLDDADTASAIFEAESEVAVVLVLSNAVSGGDSITINLPRVKITDAAEDVRGDLSQPISCTFQALEASSGDVLSTIQVTDTAV